MGYIAQPVEEVPNVSRWFGAAEVDELSREEAAVLAQQWATELADEGIVQDSSGLPDILSAALLASFREAARTGEIGAVDLDEEALGAAIERVEAQAVRAWIKTRTGHPSR
jgi:hypothetical protein